MESEAMPTRKSPPSVVPIIKGERDPSFTTRKGSSLSSICKGNEKLSPNDL
ncbi:hypothetical protein KHA80_17190 [Anaerobacillus sp. HL2]|nr:hypothetical protein KHA80_17190 [Anaerobacillus sp. HL2]